MRVSWIVEGVLAMAAGLMLVACAAAAEPIDLPPGESAVVTAGNLAWLVHAPPDGSAPIIVGTFRYGGGVDPPDPPVPPGELLVVSVMESFQPDHPNVLLLAELMLGLQKDGQAYRRADPDLTEAGKTPAWLKPVLDTNPTSPVLAVVVRGDAGYTVVAVEPLHKTVAASKAFLTKHGVKP
ncbi:hypothetical protein HQ590_13810 [bacterium]|nr:hypothetical protein [bacterium]